MASPAFSKSGLSFFRDVGLRRVEFTRPEALNALSLPMIRELTPWLHRVEPKDDAQAIIFKGSGDDNKAFCAGGDIRYLYDNAQSDETRSLCYDFFREEYRLNYLLAKMRTPVISFLNGITMGGGVGLSCHGKFIVATEKSVFAMPETKIGFFPDVGGSFILPRFGKAHDNSSELAGQGLGTYLALTGARVKGLEMQALKLATHYIETENFDHVENTISGLRLNKNLSESIRDECISGALQGLEHDVPEGDLLSPEFVPTIERIFGATGDNTSDTVEGIMDRLSKESTEWASDTLKSMESLCPLSLKVTHRQMRFGATKTMKECLQMEYRMACRMMSNPDFIEGVRAVLVDKDQSPKWSHESVEAVSEEDVSAFFAPFNDPADELVLFDLYPKEIPGRKIKRVIPRTDAMMMQQKSGGKRRPKSSYGQQQRRPKEQ